MKPSVSYGKGRLVPGAWRTALRSLRWGVRPQSHSLSTTGATPRARKPQLRAPCPGSESGLRRWGQGQAEPQGQLTPTWRPLRDDIRPVEHRATRRGQRAPGRAGLLRRVKSGLLPMGQMGLDGHTGFSSADASQDSEIQIQCRKSRGGSGHCWKLSVVGEVGGRLIKPTSPPAPGKGKAMQGEEGGGRGGP